MPEDLREKKSLNTKLTSSAEEAADFLLRALQPSWDVEMLASASREPVGFTLKGLELSQNVKMLSLADRGPAGVLSGAWSHCKKRGG